MRGASRIGRKLGAGLALLLLAVGVAHDRLLQFALATWLRHTSGHHLSWQYPGEWRGWPTLGGRLENLTLTSAEGQRLVTAGTMAWQLTGAAWWRGALMFDLIALDGLRVVWRDDASRSQHATVTTRFDAATLSSWWRVWPVRTLRLRDAHLSLAGAAWRIEIAEGWVRRVTRDAPMTIEMRGRCEYTPDPNAAPWRATLAMNFVADLATPTRLTLHIADLTTVWSGLPQITRPLPLSLNGTLRVDATAQTWRFDELVLQSADLKIHSALTGRWLPSGSAWSGYARLAEWNLRQWMMSHGVESGTWEALPSQALTRLQGDARCAGDSMTVHCDAFDLRFDRSQLRGRLSVSRALERLEIDATLDQLDLDAYRKPGADAATFERADALAGLSDALMTLAALPLQGQLLIEQLRYRGLVAHQVRIEMKP